MSMILISTDELTQFVRELFFAAGVGADEAAAVAASLVESNLRGHESHGVLRVADYLAYLRSGEVRTGIDWEVVNETPAILVADRARTWR